MIDICFNYALKDSPQPQVFEALGLLKINPLPFKPSEKSKIVPDK
jgi:hypothetical protein